MAKYIDITDEQFWQIMFDEACVEGQQAERIRKELEKIATEPVRVEWIPVSERLPDNYNNLLICQGDGYVNVGYYSLNEFKDVNSYPYKDVIAWMPLPEPFREECAE